jgi:hypothetical protein
VRVSVNGQLITTALDGRAIPMDPGRHSFRFEHAGLVIDRELLVRTTERNRVLSVKFDKPTSSKDAAIGRGDDSGGRRAVPLTLLGLGVAGLGAATYLWISGFSDRSNMMSTCATTHTCSTSAVDSAETKLVVADVVGGVGLAAGLLGVWMLLSKRAVSTPPVSVRGGPGAAKLELFTSF